MKPTVLTRRTLLRTGAVATPALLTFAARAQTQLPDKALRIIVGFAANGGADQMVRAVAPFLERRLGRHITVENKPGNTGSAAGDSLKNGPADGSVIAFMPSTTLALSVASADVKFEPLVDFAPLTAVGTFETALAVTPKAGVRTLEEYIEWTRNEDAKRRRVGMALSDSLLQMYMRSIGREIGVTLDAVAYRGSAPLVADLQDNRIAAGAGGVTAFLEYHRGNRLRMLAVSGPRRLDLAKDVPTATELGHPTLLTEEWYGYFTSARVPLQIQQEWNRQIRAAIAVPEISAQIVRAGVQMENSTQDVAAARMAAHIKMWKDRMDSLGLKPTN
ncbi:MAG: hypothetical protein JSR47_20470 [Proteobacteria bacterium]|nr:hypothetical protein [Pseudomonadota bacterium]